MVKKIEQIDNCPFDNNNLTKPICKQPYMYTCVCMCALLTKKRSFLIIKLLNSIHMIRKTVTCDSLKNFRWKVVSFSVSVEVSIIWYCWLLAILLYFLLVKKEKEKIRSNFNPDISKILFYELNSEKQLKPNSCL